MENVNPPVIRQRNREYSNKIEKQSKGPKNEPVIPDYKYDLCELFDEEKNFDAPLINFSESNESSCTDTKIEPVEIKNESASKDDFQYNLGTKFPLQFRQVKVQRHVTSFHKPHRLHSSRSKLQKN